MSENFSPDRFEIIDRFEIVDTDTPQQTLTEPAAIPMTSSPDIPVRPYQRFETVGESSVYDYSDSDLLSPVSTQPFSETQGLPRNVTSRGVTTGGAIPADRFEIVDAPASESSAGERGFFENIARLPSDIWGGVVDYAEMIPSAARALPGGPKAGQDKEGTLGKAISSIQKYKEVEDLEQKVTGSSVWDSIHGGLRAAVTSLMAGAPGAAAGAVLGTSLGPIGTFLGGVLGYALSGTSLFALNQYDLAMEESLDAGKSMKEAESYALETAIYEGGFEFGADILEGLTMGAGKIFTAPVKNVAKSALKDLFAHNFKNATARMAKVAAIETGTEMATAGLQAEAARDINLGDQKFWDAAKQAFGPSFVASVIFGAVGQAGVSKYKHDVKKALTDPTRPIEERLAAVKTISEVVKPVSAPAAQAWEATGYDAIMQKKPLDLDMKFDQEKGNEYKMAEAQINQARLKMGIKPVKVTPRQRAAYINEDFTGKPQVQKGDRQRLILVGGPAGAGKTSSIEEMMRANRFNIEDFVTINPDNYKSRMGVEGYDAVEAHEQTSDMAKEALRKALDKNYNVLFDTQLGNFEVAKEAVDTILEKGGEIGIVFTDTDAVTSRANSEIRRVSGRENRYVPDRAIIEGINYGLPTFIELMTRYGNNPRVMFTLESNRGTQTEPVPVVIGNRIVNRPLFDSIINTPYSSVLKPDGGIRYERDEQGGRIGRDTLAAAAPEIESRVNSRRVFKSTAESRAVGRRLARQSRETVEDFIRRRIRERFGGVFVSPNVDELTISKEEAEARKKKGIPVPGTLDFALSKVLSAGQATFSSIMKDVAARVGLSIIPKPAIGTWQDTVENSLYVRIPHTPDFETLRYLGAVQGLIGRQKSVVVFQADDNGTQFLYEIDTREKSMKNVHASMQKSGIESHTLSRNDDGTVKITVYDYDGAELNKIQKLGEEYEARIKVTRGRGDYLSSDSGTRPDSAKLFGEIARRYEEESPLGMERFKTWGRTDKIVPVALPEDLRDKVKQVGVSHGYGLKAATHMFVNLATRTGFRVPVNLAGKDLEDTIREKLRETNAREAQVSVIAEKLRPKISFNENFKKWFGKSILGTPDNPTVLYHSTFDNFNQFTVGDIGFHFGTLDQAMHRLHAKKQYAASFEEAVKREDITMPVYLRLENPIELPDSVWLSFENVLNAVEKELSKQGKEWLEEDAAIISKIRWGVAKQVEKSDDIRVKVPTQQFGLNALRRALQNLGYDGIKYKNVYEGWAPAEAIKEHRVPSFITKTEPEYSYIVFDANQVKSVYNEGFFSDSKNIYLNVLQRDRNDLYNTLIREALTVEEFLEIYEDSCEDARNIYELINNALSRALPPDVADRVLIGLKESITAADIGADIGASLQGHGITYEELQDYVIGGLTETYMPNVGAVIHLSFMLSDQYLEHTTYHESFHLAAKWLLPDEDMEFLLKTYGNEEKTADAFAEYAMARPEFKAPESRVEEIFRTLKRYLQYIYNWLSGNGFSRPEDVFGKILTHGYKMQPDSIIAGRVLHHAEERMSVREKGIDRALIEEARKYKTAEEFVDAQGEYFYHGSPKEFKAEDIDFAKGNLREGIYLSNSQAVAKDYGKNVHKYKINPKAKELDLSDGEITLDYIKKNEILEEGDIDTDLENYILGGRIFQYDPYNRIGIVDDILATAASDGYDIVKLFDDLGGESDNIATIVLNKDVIKTEAQLIDIWNEAHKKPLIEEAKRYKTAEEFVESSGTPVYRGGQEITEIQDNRGIPFSKEKSVADVFAEGKKKERPDLPIKTIEMYLDKNARIANKQNIPEDVLIQYENMGNILNPVKREMFLGEWARKNGFDAIDYQSISPLVNKEAEIRILNQDVLKTKAQLIDIWNEAHKPEPSATQPISTDRWEETPQALATKPPLDDDIADLVFYNGIQQGFRHMPDQHLFTDKTYSGATFAVSVNLSNEEINNAIRKKMKTFSVTTPESVKANFKQSLDAIYKHTGQLAVIKGEEANRLKAEQEAARVRRANQNDPIVALNGTPYKTRQAAALAGYNLTKQYGHDYSVVEHQGGFALQRVTETRDPFAKDMAIKEAQTLKEKIEIATGVMKTGDIFTEGEVLDVAMAKAEKESALAIRVGKEEATEKEKEKAKEKREKAKEKKEAMKEISRMVKDLAEIRKRVDKLPRNQAKAIHDLIDDIDLKKPTKKTLKRLTATRDFIADHPELSPMPHDVLSELKRLEMKPFRSLTLEEMRTVYDAVKHHVHLARRINTIKAAQKDRNFRGAVKDMLTELKPAEEINKDLNAQTEKATPFRDLWDNLSYFFGLGQEHYDFIIEKLGGLNSVFYHVFYKDLKAGVINRMKETHDAFDLLKKRQKEYGFDESAITDVSRWLNETVTVAGFELTRGHRMALYRHWLNADNRKSITDIAGGFTIPTNKDPNKIYSMTIYGMEEIIGSLSEQERAFAGDAVTQHFEEQGKRMAETFYQLNGYELKLVDFYYPKETAPLARGLDVDKESAREEFHRKYLRVGIPKGMTKERQNVVVPIKLNSIAYDINKSTLKAAAYNNLEEPLSNAARVLFDRGKIDRKTGIRTPGFRQEFISRYGRHGDLLFKTIEKGLRDISGEWETYSIVEEGLIKIKNHISTAILGLNPFVMLKQVMSLPLYLPYVKSEHLMSGMAEAMTNPKFLNNQIKLFSPEYRERVEGGFSRDVMDVFKTGMVKRVYGGKQSIPERVMGGIKIFDQVAVMSGIAGARNQVLAEFKEGNLSKEVKEALNITNADIVKLSPEQKVKYAYEYGDYVTERTQPMFSPEHRSTLSRGGPWIQMFTMFSSFTNQAYNLVKRSIVECMRTRSKESYTKLGKVLFLLFVVNTFGVMAIDWLREVLYQKEEKYRRPIWRGILDNWAGYMYFIRDIEKALASQIEKGSQFGYDVALPVHEYPKLIVSTARHGFESITTKSSGQRRKEALRFIDDAAALLALTRGIPYRTPKNIAVSGYKVYEKIESKRRRRQILESWSTARPVQPGAQPVAQPPPRRSPSGRFEIIN